ncbi:Uncharacterised protein [Mycobacteroides abscessus]|nr:Uncharacterised protein [Mycobacteroides abscessus]
MRAGGTAGGVPVIDRSIASIAASASAATGCSSVVSLGRSHWPTRMPSHPTTERSSGMEIPCSSAAPSIPTATMSLPTNTAVGAFPGRVR